MATLLIVGGHSEALCYIENELLESQNNKRVRLRSIFKSCSCEEARHPN